MKARYLFLMIVATLAVCALASDRTNAMSSSESEVGPLQKQIRELESRVKALEQRLERVESRNPPLMIWVQPPTNLKQGETPRGFLPELNQHPKNWQERKFNGIPFYIIPCTDKQGSTSQGSEDQN